MGMIGKEEENTCYVYDWEGEGEYMLCMIGKEEVNTCCGYDWEGGEYMLLV